jgi:hypothetical protein
MAVKTGKWYWEIDIVADSDAGLSIGIKSLDSMAAYSGISMFGYPSVTYYSLSGDININGSSDGYGDSFSTGNIVSVALDMDAETIEYFKNNVSQGAIDIGSDGSGYLPGASDGGTGTAGDMVFKFLESSWDYAAPAGYKAINSLNMPAPEILEGNEGMDTVLYTGTGAEKSITDLEFSPDLVWIKERDDAVSHNLYDTIRTPNQRLKSDSSNEEDTVITGLSSFDSNGWTMGAHGAINGLNDLYAAWNWRKDPKFGFDIVGYEGTGIAHTEIHSLGVVPEMMIVKRRDTAGGDWQVYHKQITATHYLKLNEDNASAAATVVWNDTEPTSSVFTVGINTDVNLLDDNTIAYLFASIPGYSKVFSYTGNGNDDGPFVYCGFRPRFILGKNSSVVQNWFLYDTERGAYNLSDNLLYADLANAETTPGTHGMDILSNGFKTRGVSQMLSGSGNTIIGIAFAEHPFKFANAR